MHEIQKRITTEEGKIISKEVYYTLLFLHKKTKKSYLTIDLISDNVYYIIISDITYNLGGIIYV